MRRIASGGFPWGWDALIRQAFLNQLQLHFRFLRRFPVLLLRRTAAADSGSTGFRRGFPRPTSACLVRVGGLRQRQPASGFLACGT
jgi:hypothetical protein